MSYYCGNPIHARVAVLVTRKAFKPRARFKFTKITDHVNKRHMNAVAQTTSCAKSPPSVTLAPSLATAAPQTRIAKQVMTLMLRLQRLLRRAHNAFRYWMIGRVWKV
jgi:hypothetical protein